MSARRPIAVLLSRFPLVTETFILREIISLERQGQPVELVPLLRESPQPTCRSWWGPSGPFRRSPGVIHPEARPWVDRALYTPFVSRDILRSNWRALVSSPRRYAGLLAEVLWGSRGSLNLLLGTLGIFPKSVHIAERLAAAGVRHVHAHFATHPAMAAFIVSRLSGIPWSFTAHAHDIFVHRAMLHEKIKEAAFVRTISRFNKDFLLRLYPDVPSEKLFVIHAGCDPARYEAAATPEMERPLRLLSVAALKPYKGLAVLVEACRRLKDQGLACRCDVVGEGPERPRLEARIVELGLSDSVHLLGARTQSEVAALLADASLFVLPSVILPNGQMEGIPVALMEAMASGKAVVASSLSGTSELVGHGVHGLLVEPGDVDALASAISGLAADRARAQVMGAQGRLKVLAEFSLDRCVAKLLDVIDGSTFPVCDGAPPPSRLGSGLSLRVVHDGRDSRVLEITVPSEGSSERWICKVHRSRPGESRPAPERARHEFELLRRLQALRMDGRFGVPRPLDLDEGAAWLVMESCPGMRLDALIRASRGRELEDAVHRSGEWLRVFHARTVAHESASVSLDRMADEAERRLAWLTDRALGPREARRLVNRIAELRERLDASTVRVTGRHGDFWPGNVFVHPETVTVIDFEGFAEGVPLEDVAHFILHLDLFSSHPLRRRAQSLTETFSKGYRGSDSLDPTLYAFCRLTGAVKLLACSLEAAPTSALGAWHRRRVLRAICRERPAPLSEGRSS